MESVIVMPFMVGRVHEIINIDYHQAMDWLSTAQTAHRLGVKPATVYAYVSRGVLHNHRDPDTRRSRFDAGEVERLAVRGRPRDASRVRSLDLQIETAITQIAETGSGGHAIRYRGHDQSHLARTATFEQVAELIWTGELPPEAPVWPGGAELPSLAAAPLAGDRLFERLRLVVALDGIGARRSADPVAFVDTGRRLIATMVDALPLRGAPPMSPDIAARLWARLSPLTPSPSLLRVLDATMVMLADHEMAASTLAARVAASTRGGVHDVVTAGFGALGGPLHGGESERVRRLLLRAEATSVRAMVDDALGRYGRLPGYGQTLYPEGDPRAAVLLGMLRTVGPSPTLALVDEVTAEAVRRRLPPPNVDLTLAVLGATAEMPLDAGAAIFAPARVVGWLAHALEELAETPLRFRPRAVYVGDPARRT